MADDCHGQPPPPPSADATHDAQPPTIHLRSVETHAGGVQIGSEEDFNSMQPGPEPGEPVYFDQSEQVHIDVTVASSEPGVVYAAAVPTGSIVLSAADVVHSGTPAPVVHWPLCEEDDCWGLATLSFTDIDAESHYDIFVVGEDEAGNLTPVLPAAPLLSAPHTEPEGSEPDVQWLAPRPCCSTWCPANVPHADAALFAGADAVSVDGLGGCIVDTERVCLEWYDAQGSWYHITHGADWDGEGSCSSWGFCLFRDSAGRCHEWNHNSEHRDCFGTCAHRSCGCSEYCGGPGGCFRSGQCGSCSGQDISERDGGQSHEECDTSC